MESVRTAAALIIGNELLTGKVQDVNVQALARELFALGVSMRRVVICPDEIDVIVEDLNTLRRDHDWVVTSGGVGPTHDDVTIQAVARAFDREIVREPRLEGLLRDYFGDRLTDAHLRMAGVPSGAEMVLSRGVGWPLVLVENVFILPGLPEIFRRKLPALAERVGAGRPFLSRAVHTLSDEGDLAPLLDRLCVEHPDIAIGSYPRWGDAPYRVAVTFDGRDADAVDAAVNALRAELPPDQIVDQPEGS